MRTGKDCCVCYRPPFSPHARATLHRYFKRIDIPEMDKLRLPLSDQALTWSHANNTLVVSYAKPLPVMQAEAQEREETNKIRPQEGDVDCKQQ